MFMVHGTNVILKLLAGKRKDISAMIWIVSALFMLKIIVSILS